MPRFTFETENNHDGQIAIKIRDQQSSSPVPADLGPLDGTTIDLPTGTVVAAEFLVLAANEKLAALEA